MNKTEINAKLDIIDNQSLAVKSCIEQIQRRTAEIRLLLNETEPTEISYGIAQRIGRVLFNDNANILSGYSTLEHLSNGKLRAWYLWQRIKTDGTKENFFLSCISDTGLSGDWKGQNVENALGNPNQGYGPTTSTKFKGKYYHVYNRPAQNQLCEKRFFVSLNGHTWTEYSTSKIWRLGEDHTLAVINSGTPDEKMIMPTRLYMPNHPLANGMRHIYLMTTEDGNIWSDPVELFKATNPNEQYYSMSICEIKRDNYFACLNIFNESTQQVSMRLMKSTNLLNWAFLQDVPLEAGVNQNFGAVSYDSVKKLVDILVVETADKHNTQVSKFGLTRYQVQVSGV